MLECIPLQEKKKNKNDVLDQGWNSLNQSILINYDCDTTASKICVVTY